MIAVSAVSLLLIVTLTTVVLTQCLLMARMRNHISVEVMTPTVKIIPNEAYGLHRTTSSSEELEATYEIVK